MSYHDHDHCDCDDRWYSDEPDTGWFREEPCCTACSDTGWVKPHGILRRVLARIAPLCLIWWRWRGLINRWWTLQGTWPCPCCNATWIDTWWLPRTLHALRWHLRNRRLPRIAAHDEPPF